MNQEDQTELYSRMHAEWLMMPMTKLALKAIDAHANKHNLILTRDALNETIPDSKIRGVVISMQNTNALKTLLMDFNIMNKQLNVNKENE